MHMESPIEAAVIVHPSTTTKVIVVPEVNYDKSQNPKSQILST